MNIAIILPFIVFLFPEELLSMFASGSIRKAASFPNGIVPSHNNQPLSLKIGQLLPFRSLAGHNSGLPPPLQHRNNSFNKIAPVPKGSSRDDQNIVDGGKKKAEERELVEILGKRMAKILPKNKHAPLFLMRRGGRFEIEGEEADDWKNVELVAKLLANYEYRHKVAEFSSEGSAKEKVYAGNLEEAVVLLKAMHESDRLGRYGRHIGEIEEIVKKKEEAKKEWIKANLWGLLGIRNGDEDVNEKAAEVMAPILAAKQFAARISKDFEIRNSADDLGERAADILKNMENAIKAIDSATTILLKCDNFRDNNFWKMDRAHLKNGKGEEVNNKGE